jgi:tetratricopeptide (TPR) repeat protein
MTTMLEQAVAHIKAGNIDQAKSLLIEVLKQNPGDESAWLWMTKCVTETEQKRYCFEKALKINPQNQYAIKALERLNNPISPKTEPGVQIVQPQPVKKKRLGVSLITLGIVVVGVALVLLFLFVWLFVPRTSNGPGSTTMAYIMCQKFVEERLGAPATAKFPKESEIETFTVKDKKDAFQIKGYVDAENPEGAFLRNYYVCEVSYVGNDKWHLDYLNFEK